MSGPGPDRAPAGAGEGVTPDERTVVLRHARVLTMDPARPEAEAVVVRGDRIVAAGPAGLAQAHPDAVQLDLGGRTLVPGFIDAHCHLSIAALQPSWGDASGASSPADLARVVAEQAARTPAGAWIRVEGWDDVATGLRLDRHDLDAAAGDRPVLVVHSTYHQGVVSSAGLDRLGIGRRAGDGEDLVVRDGAGRPTGLLLERAFGRAHTASMADYGDPDRWADHIAARARALLAHGITAVHDAACDPATEAVYARMARDGTLPLSVLVMPHPAPFLTHDFGDRLDGPPTGEGDAWLRVGPLKLFADGGVLPAIDVHVGGSRVGFGYRHPDLAERLTAAVERGFRVGVHAMGNRGLADALDAFRAAARRRPDEDHRFRVEHAGLAGPGLIRELAAIGAVAVVQPGFVDHVGEQAGDFRPEDADWLPFASLAEAGIPLAGSSDDPCGPVAPLTAAHFGVTRRTRTGRPFGPDQRLPFEDWLRAYTIGAAYAGGQEGERGSITAGKRADLVVLDGSLDASTPPAVIETWVAGRRVYERPVQ